MEREQRWRRRRCARGGVGGVGVVEIGRVRVHASIDGTVMGRYGTERGEKGEGEREREARVKR